MEGRKETVGAEDNRTGEVNKKKERENRKKNVVIKGVRWETGKIEQEMNL